MKQSGLKLTFRCGTPGLQAAAKLTVPVLPAALLPLYSEIGQVPFNRFVYGLILHQLPPSGRKNIISCLLSV